MKAHNFSERVKRRSRRIVSESSTRKQEEPFTTASPVGSQTARLLGKLVKKLPTIVQDVLHEALGGKGDLQRVKTLLREAQLHRAELAEREASLEKSFQEIRSERKSLQELRLNLRGQLKTVQARTGTLVGSIKRVPLGDIKYDVSAAPRRPVELRRLAQNLKRFGQQTPVVAALDDHGFNLITGYRRMEALKLAGFTHVDVRITEPLDPETAAALYIAENCLVRGVSLSEVRRLEAQVSDQIGFSGPIAIVRADDEELEEEMTLTDVTSETLHHLAEAAAWLSALRPYWKDIQTQHQRSLVELLRYFAQSARQLK